MYFFKQLPSDIVSALSAAASHVSAHPETTIVRQGAKGDSFFVIISGSVSIHKKDMENNEDVKSGDIQNENGSEKAVIQDHFFDIDERFGPCICVLTSGESFGLLSLSKETQRAASVITREETELIMIKKTVYDSYLKEHVNVIES